MTLIAINILAPIVIVITAITIGCVLVELASQT
jgi:hypothetical protein